MIKKIFSLLLMLLIIQLSGCESGNHDETIMSAEEQIIKDSLSKVAQKTKSDSLKKLNPLLIVPPDSLYSGDYLDKYPNGLTKFKGTFRFGQRHGQWLSFYPSGFMWSEMHYNKGLRQGPNITYYESGKLRYSGYYSNDAVDSLWCYYDSTGVLVEKLEYENDRLIKRWPVK